MLPSEWITIGSAALTAALACLGFVDVVWHTSLLGNPITAFIIAVASLLGIHQTIKTNNALKGIKK